MPLLRPNGDDKLNFKNDWITRILSPMLQKVLVAGLGELWFPAECVAGAVTLLHRNTKNLIEFHEWNNPQTLIRKQWLLDQIKHAFKQAESPFIWFDVCFTDDLHQHLPDATNQLVAAGRHSLCAVPQ
jgi:hypothetical protein